MCVFASGPYYHYLTIAQSTGRYLVIFRNGDEVYMWHAHLEQVPDIYIARRSNVMHTMMTPLPGETLTNPQLEGPEWGTRSGC